MNKTQIAAVFLIVSSILLSGNPTVGGLMFFGVAIIYFAYFAIKGE